MATCKSYIKVRFLAIIVSLCVIVPLAKAQHNLYELKIGHPRIMMSKYDELAFRFIMLEDPVAEKLTNELRKDADKLLNSKELKYSIDDRNTMIGISREYLRRIITLSLAYRIFEEDKYSDKAIDEMLDACSYPDWNPNYFLDVAEMTAAMAIGYDWNFYHLNVRQKETIRNRIVELGLNPGLEVYQQPEGKPYVWYEMKNYWNQVCAGGLILGALAVGEDFPDLKNRVIYNAVKNLVPTINMYEPAGVWYEGPESWNYANVYMAMILSSLNSALEHDFGITGKKGIKNTTRYFANTISPSGKVFNFADAASSEVKLNPAFSWFSKFYQQGDVLGYYKQMLENNLTRGRKGYGQGRERYFYLALPWYDDGITEPLIKPKAASYEGLLDLLVLQSNDQSTNGMYLAAKGGKGTLFNQQLDAGTFIIEANGERWGIDLGGENVSLPNFYDKKVGGRRWSYYRNTNKSHSTLVLGTEIQYPEGESKLARFQGDQEQPFGILDMTKVYSGTTKAERGFKLLSNDQVLIRDEIQFAGTGKSVRWGFMTDAQVRLSGNSVTLSKNGKSFYLQAVSNAATQFKVEPAKAYHKDAKDNTGYQLVYFVVNGDSSASLVDISVVMGNNINTLSPVILNASLESW